MLLGVKVSKDKNNVSVLASENLKKDDHKPSYTITIATNYHHGSEEHLIGAGSNSGEDRVHV